MSGSGYVSRRYHDGDRKPYVSPRGVRYARGDLYFGQLPLSYAPREEFEVPTPNANPILVEFREFNGDPESWLDWILGKIDLDHEFYAPVTRDHFEHALAVLKRLANL